MNNLKLTLTKLLKNKNTVTIICVLLALVILYVGYNWRVNSATEPINVPYARVEIQPRTLVTEEMIGYMKIPKSMVTTNTIRSINDVIGMYANYNTVIPQGSVFYRSVLVDWSEMPDSAWADIPDGYTVVSLPVNTEMTYGNSIFPGNYIDLYYVATEETNKLLLGKMIESIEVLAVKDSSGKHVFENSADLAAPASLIFAVPEEMHLLLRKASYLNGDIIPVPRNASYSENPSATVVTSEYIQDFILSQTVTIPYNDLPQMNENITEDNTTPTE